MRGERQPQGMDSEVTGFRSDRLKLSRNKGPSTRIQVQNPAALGNRTASDHTAAAVHYKKLDLPQCEIRLQAHM